MKSSLDDREFAALVEELRERVAARVPEWTDHNDSDPGVTLLQLLAFFVGEIGQRAELIPARGRPYLGRVRSELLALRDGGCEVGAPLERVHYFEGKLLTAADFRAEQDYVRGKQRRHNRLLHGYGVVCGLEVAVEEGTIRVSPGLAIDRQGDELAVPEVASRTIPADAPAWYVVLAYAERAIDPVPVPGPGEPQPSRIEEGFRLGLEAEPPAGAVPLARLVRDGERWACDPDFEPPRAG